MKYHLTNSLAVDRFAAIKLANLNYKEGSERMDDHGALWIAPVVWTNWDAPVGLLAVYASTNGDPILLGQIEDGELTWFDETQETPGLQSVLHALQTAEWIHPKTGDGYSWLLEDSIPARA